MSSQETRTVRFDKVGNISMMVSLVGLLACGAGFATVRETFLQSYLFGYIFWISLTLGCFGITLFHHTIRGSWGLSALRLWEAGGGPASLATMAVLFIPVLIGMPTLYHGWYSPDLSDSVLAHKAAYLNPGFFTVRLVAYFALWTAMAWFLRTSSLRQDKSQNPDETARRTNVSAFGLVLFVLTCSLAITDWVMSLDPHWFSAIYGVWFVVGQGLAALSFGTFVVCQFAKMKPYSDIVTPKLTTDLGNMMFAFTLLWAYMTVSQFIIMWSGNLPEFITYYANRREGYWNALGAFNVVFQFFAPFMLLLSPRLKAKPEMLAKVAVLIFSMRLVDIFWNVVPMMRPSGPAWTDLAALAFIGGVWFAVFANQIRKASILPEHDTRLLEAAHQHA